MANFAKTQLLKYGWKEGKGLGKNENGLTEALKPMLKFDKAGIGYNENSFELWWETLYDNTAKNIKVELCDNKVSLSIINNSNMIDGWNAVSSKKSDKTEQQKYGNFLKASTFHNGHLIQDTSTEKEKKTTNDSVCMPITDEQLYKTSDDRTVHKTARHGLASNGKLERIAQQDRTLLDVSVGSVSQLDASLVKENTMTYRKTNVELDTDDGEDPEESQEVLDDQNKLQHEIEDLIYRSKSSKKSYKKKLNKLTEQFSICSLKGNIDSNNSLHNKELARSKKERESQLDIKSGKCSKKKNKKKKCFVEELRVAYNLHKIASDIQNRLKNGYTRKNGSIKNIHSSKSQQSSLQQRTYVCQNQRSPVVSSLNNLNDLGDKNTYQIMLLTCKEKRNMKFFDDVEPSIKKFYSLHYDKLDTSSKILCKSLSTCSTESQLHISNSDDKLHNKDKKIKKKTDQQKQVKKQLEKVINPVNFGTDDLNTVIKKLTTFDLTEEVSVNALKKKLTQTHLTPV